MLAFDADGPGDVRLGYAMVPMYKGDLRSPGINVLAVSEMRDTLAAPKKDGMAGR